MVELWSPKPSMWVQLLLPLPEIVTFRLKFESFHMDHHLRGDFFY